MASIDSMRNKIESLHSIINTRDKRNEALKFELEALKNRGRAIDNPERMSLFSQIDHLHRSLMEQSQVIDMYQQWFKNNQYWTQIHNSIMKYNPHLGRYEHEGGDVEIVIPEVEQWEVVKLSTIAGEVEEE